MTFHHHTLIQIILLSSTFLLHLTPPTANSFSLQPQNTLPSTPRKKIALITGGNKGIGKEIARRIGSDPEFTAIIASRDVELGRLAALELRENPLEDPSTLFGMDDGEHDDDDDYDNDDENDEEEGEEETAPQCDVISLPTPFDLTQPTTITDAYNYIQSTYGHLDVLINNAAICFNDPTLYGKVPYTPFRDQADITIRTNFYGTLQVTQTFLPLLQQSPSPRIINIASYAGRLTQLRSPSLMEQFTSPSLTMDELSTLMDQFVSHVREGTHEQHGWPNTCYGMSKLGVIAMTRVMAREHPGIMVNSVDPGYCRTDQNDHRGSVDPLRGAYTPYLLAVMEVEGGDEYDDWEDYGVEEGEEEEVLSGLHFYEEQEIPWTYQ